MVVTSLPILGATYQMNTTTPSTQNTINLTPITSTPNRTITLTSGGKTMTLSGGAFQPGTQYFLSKIKGNIPTLMIADKAPIVALNSSDTGKNVQVTKTLQPSPSTSKQLYTKVKIYLILLIVYRIVYRIAVSHIVILK